MITDIPSQVEVIKRGSVELISEKDLIEKLNLKRPLRVKAGFDPTSPDLHLGHTVLLQKLKQFQDLGHQVVFLIGDFTAMIGDPSGRSQTRPSLSDDDIRKNVETYQKQVFKILDPTRTEVVFNSHWMDKLSSRDMIRLASRETVARMLERDDFEKRYEKGSAIAIHEFLYPILQGYDSVELKADVEIGGTDQKFNLLMGRELQRQYGQSPQIVLTMPLLVGTDGVQKMSKSYGNAIAIQDPPKEIVGKTMSITDDLMWNYYELLSDLSQKQIADLKLAVKDGSAHPKEVKKNLASEITARFWGREAAREAVEEFEKIFKSGGLPEEIEVVTFKPSDAPVSVADLLLQIGLVPSKTEARRLIMQGGISINDAKISVPTAQMDQKGEHLFRVGKRKFKKVIFG